MEISRPRRSLATAACALALLLSPIGVCLAAAPAASTDWPAVGEGGLSPGDALALHATALRLVAGTSPDKLSQLTTGEEGPALQPLFAQRDDRARAAVQQFLLHSMQLVSVKGTSATVGWWNPFADAWVITSWTLQARQWRLRETRALLGADLEDSSTSPTTPAVLQWPRRGGLLAAELWTNHRDRLRLYEQAVRSGTLPALLTDGSRQQRAWLGIVDRQSLFEATLFKLSELAGYQQFESLLHRTITAPTAGVLIAASLRTRLAALPRTALRTLQPVMVAHHDDGYTVIEQSPIAPTFLVFARLRNPGGSSTGNSATVLSLNAVSLLATGAFK